MRCRRASATRCSVRVDVVGRGGQRHLVVAQHVARDEDARLRHRRMAGRVGVVGDELQVHEVVR